LAASTTGLRHRVETFFPLPFLGLAHAVLAVSDPRVPHVKVATSPPVVREPYLRPVGDGDPAVGGPPDHDRGALGTTRVGLDQEVRALLGILVAALGSRHRLTRPSAVEALIACRLRLPLPDCLPTTASEPIEGTTVDSSPVDHRTRKSDPVTPVTTPSRGASPTFLEETCTRSPTTAMYRMVPLRGVSGQRGPAPFARRRFCRLFNVPSLRGATLDPGWLRPATVGACCLSRTARCTGDQGRPTVGRRRRGSRDCWG
jgi:hypothetical protein